MADGSAAAINGWRWLRKAVAMYITMEGRQPGRGIILPYVHRNDPVVRAAGNLGGNYFTDNEARVWDTFYDENLGGDYSGTWLVHDNVIKENQVGPAFDINLACCAYYKVRVGCTAGLRMHPGNQMDCT